MIRQLAIPLQVIRLASGTVPMKRRKKAALTSQLGHRPNGVPLPPARWPNEHDNAVTEQLRDSPAGGLKVDKYAEFLKGRPKSESGAILVLREALIEVYQDAARLRAEARASKEKIRSADAALRSLWSAVKQLEEVLPHHGRGLKGVFALPIEDPKGLDERTGFSADCAQARVEIIGAARRLARGIRDEKAKPSSSGERKKRLRVLTEALAEWWIHATGKRIAPYVQTKPLGNHQAFVARRGGLFVEFAVSVLCDLDQFKRSEVISAVTNVYGQRRQQRLTG